ncbi:hypothetical protein CLV71_101518 [Actinophytocola oryzae]|uniref:Uncharacterized protein n=1 Tax=Actinophytocola oryzae TaxID=502181 RepID=A0A4R7W5V1_9PSEU|nr:hypothetical protein CLV71_101518 [Actinophytocola oryzae]
MLDLGAASMPFRYDAHITFYSSDAVDPEALEFRQSTIGTETSAPNPARLDGRADQLVGHPVGHARGEG